MMLKLIAATALLAVVYCGAAVADEMGDFQTCWSSKATSYLDQNGVSEKSLKWAVAQADMKCYDEKQKAGAEAREMRSYMEVQLYNANPVSDQEPKIEKVSGHQARTDWALYNARTGYLCMLPLDSEPMRQLVDSGRLELARQKRGCIVIEQPIEVEEVRRFGRTMEVRYVNANGQLVEAYTSDWTFRTKKGWNSIGIE